MPDQPRCGAPSKLTEAHRNQLKEWVDAEALTSRALVSRLATECRIRISASTLRTELKQLGYVWKRTRYSLKKNATRSGLSRPNSILTD
ncbi:MAG: winged helix-turn-helix domain-containing protein [Methylococcales bacterium]|nr:winged helix-turn-helix domain-containing protein [Methylococcales bacterium]